MEIEVKFNCWGCGKEFKDTDMVFQIIENRGKDTHLICCRCKNKVGARLQELIGVPTGAILN